MDERELAELRTALEGFASEVFEGFARSDQRATGLRYLRGLMLDGQRKSMQPMAARLGVDHQQLQQFLTSSTWDYVAVRRRLAARAIEVVDPQVWVVDDTGFAKDGKASPCVARQYSGTLGKVGNCQIAVSVHAVTDAASAVLDWRLFVPESWDETCVSDEEGNVEIGMPTGCGSPLTLWMRPGRRNRTCASRYRARSGSSTSCGGGRLRNCLRVNGIGRSG